METIATADRKPAPPTIPATGPSQDDPRFRFPFQRPQAGFYSNTYDQFPVLREHVMEIRRLVKDHNAGCMGAISPLSMCDVVNAALEFALEHAQAFRGMVTTDQPREALGSEVYRKAFLHFLRHETA